MTRVEPGVTSESLGGRLLRASTWAAVGFGTAQLLRLVSNLLLTRMLFPEAFGVMAILAVFVVGLQMLSDVGIGPLIQQHRRGDEDDFLDTAWTFQVIRGVCLWFISCAIAVPAGWLYGNDMIAAMLPVVGLSLIISGLHPTKVDLANRHLNIGRVTIVDASTQVVGLGATLIAAYCTRSAWSLAIGWVIASLAGLIMSYAFVPGRANRWRWDRGAVREITSFGRWILPGTICSFLIAQGDRAIIGTAISMDRLGVYNIGHFLGMFPIALAGALTGRVLIPVYRERPPRESERNFASLSRMRMVVTAVSISMMATLAMLGDWVVRLLYDDRFHDAGGVVVIVSCISMVQVIGMTYEYSALSAGDSRSAFIALAFKSIMHVCFLLIGVATYGLLGALVGIGAAALLAHPLLVGLARKHGAWDVRHDATWGVVVLLVVPLAVALHWHRIARISAF